MLNLKVTRHFCQNFSKYLPSTHWRFVLKFQNHLSDCQRPTSLCQPCMVSTLSSLRLVVTLSSSHESHRRSHRRNEEGFSREPSLADSQEAVQAAGVPSHQRGQFIISKYYIWSLIRHSQRVPARKYTWSSMLKFRPFQDATIYVD